MRVRVLAHLVLLPLAGWALLQIVELRTARDVIVWLIAAAVLHDLVLLPAYSALDRLAMRSARRSVNYVRVPAGIWLLLGLVFFPVIAGKGDGAFHYVSGVHFEGYLIRWLLAGAALFAASALLHLARRP